MFNFILGWFVRLSGNVRVGERTRVRWWGLRNCRKNKLQIGEDSLIYCRIDFDSPSGSVKIGNRTYIGASHLVCHSSIIIGDDVIISWGATIVDHNSHPLNWSDRRHDVADWAQGRKNWNAVAIAPVIVENKVWIGLNACILKGVTIGEGAIVGAGAVVTKNVPRFAMVAGNPAQVIRQSSEERS